MPTVADVLKRIERIKKDLEYVQDIKEKWSSQQSRFPKICAGILEQEQAFEHEIKSLRNLGVQAGSTDLSEPEPPLNQANGDIKPQITPAISSPARRSGSASDRLSAIESPGGGANRNVDIFEPIPVHAEAEG